MTTDLVDVACAVCGSSNRATARVRVPSDAHAARMGAPGGRSSWVVCGDCGLVYQSPRPGPDGVAEMYEGGSYHAADAGVPDHYVRYSLRRSRDAIAWGIDAIGRRQSPGRALDIGCGIGGAMLDLRERGWEVAGVEPDPALSAYGRSTFDLDIRTGLFPEGTVADGERFDLVFASHVWEHVDDPVAITRAVGDVLAEGGAFLVVVPTFRRSRTLSWHAFKSPHNFMFTDVSLGNVMAAAGFRVVRQRFHHAADSELWVLAQPVAREESDIVREAVGRVQRELATVPLRIPLGLPRRVATHLQTLHADPRDFVARLRRWLRVRTRALRRR